MRHTKPGPSAKREIEGRVSSGGAASIAKIFHDIPLVGPNAISKNSNNVVKSSPRVFIFSGIIAHINLIRYIRSRDHAHFRFGRQGASIFFQTRFSRQPFELSLKFFQALVPTEGLYLSSGVHWGRRPNLRARPPKVNFFYFFYGTCPGAGGRNLSYGNHSNGEPL